MGAEPPQAAQLSLLQAGEVPPRQSDVDPREPQVLLEAVCEPVRLPSRPGAADPLVEGGDQVRPPIVQGPRVEVDVHASGRHVPGPAERGLASRLAQEAELGRPELERLLVAVDLGRPALALLADGHQGAVVLGEVGQDGEARLGLLLGQEEVGREPEVGADLEDVPGPQRTSQPGHWHRMSSRNARRSGMS